MSRIIKSNFVILRLLLLVWGVTGAALNVKAMPTRITLQDNDQVSCKITVLKSTGEIQRGAYAKVFGNFEKFEADENGVITVTYRNSSYSHSANIYLNGESDEYMKSINLDQEKKELTVYLDRIEDIIEYKRTARLFPIEGMVVDDKGEPLERATVSIQGTGRRTFTDEMGLFKIDGDFNHTVVIRANGMNNLSFPVTHFLQGDENFVVAMKYKSNWELYSSAEIMPEFPGGMEAFQHYLNKNLEYPEKAKKAKIEGVVVVQFIVDTNGDITNPHIARHLEASLDSAALKLINNMPKWSPASDYGNRIRCKYSLPVAFKIPKPKPVVPIDSISLAGRLDSLALDSVQRRQKVVADSLAEDSLHKNVQLGDSMNVNQKFLSQDSLQQDSTRMLMEKNQPVVKAKKRNVFVRFFRWLFGIERRQRRRAEKEALMLIQQDSIIGDSLARVNMPKRKGIPNADVKICNDSVKLNVDSLNINLKELTQKAKEVTGKTKESEEPQRKAERKEKLVRN